MQYTRPEGMLIRWGDFLGSLVVLQRFAAHRFGGLNAIWNKMSAELVKLENVTPDWIEPLRANIVRLGRAAGYPMERRTPGVPVVTYVNRQGAGRRLDDEDAERVVERMWQLHADKVIEFHDAMMEEIPKDEQFCLAAKTDVSLGFGAGARSEFGEAERWLRRLIDLDGRSWERAQSSTLDEARRDGHRGTSSAVLVCRNDTSPSN
jgi:hypothetical protein